MGKSLIILGAGILLLGVLLYYVPNALSWFGRLPGDIRIERENSVFYFPITTMILLSVLISVVSWFLRR